MPPPTVSGMNTCSAVRRTTSTIVSRPSRRRRDVEERQLVGTLGVVDGGHLDRVAGVAQVLEVDALHHPPGVDVQAGDHPNRDAHQLAAVRRPHGGDGGQRLGQGEPPGVQRLPDDRALDAPAAAASASATRSATSAIPPQAITGAGSRRRPHAAARRSGPQRAVLADVRDDVAGAAVAVQPLQGLATGRRRRVVQPRAASRCAPRDVEPDGDPLAVLRDRLAHHSGSSSAAVPRLTRAQPVASARLERGVVADAAGQLDGHVQLADDVGQQLGLQPRPNAASRSTRWIHSAPSRCQASAASSGSP